MMHRLEYAEIIQIQMDLGNMAICGYIREPVSDGSRIKGYCFIKRGYCYDQLPQDEKRCPHLREMNKRL